MKLNERILSFYATCDSPADYASFLRKKGEHNTAYHRRWFVLRGNMLFYFEDRHSREPLGVVILEGCTIELCDAAQEFAFAIKFDCPKSRTYVLAAESQAAMEAWVKALSRASFGYLRLLVRELEQQLEEMQEGPPGSRRVQSGWLPHRKNKTALNLVALGSARPQEKPAFPGKENGCALWDNPEASTSQREPGGSQAGSCSGAKSHHDGGLMPPPLPPRRRSLPSKSGGADGQRSDSPVSFPKLHDWYGKEILALQRAWLEDGQRSSP